MSLDIQIGKGLQIIIPGDFRHNVIGLLVIGHSRGSAVKAMVRALVALNRHLGPSAAPVDDFMLMPKDERNMNELLLAARK